MKKIAWLLLASFVLMLGAGCSGGGAPVNNPGDPDFFSDIDSDISFFECVLLQDREETVPFWYEAGTSIADEALEKIRKAADELGCSITLKMNCNSEGTSDNAQAIILTQSAGTSAGDIFFGDSYVNYLLASSGNALPLTNVKDHLNYENAEKFGGANIQELCLINSVPYAVTPVTWPEMLPNMRDVLIVNTDISSGIFGKEDPRELVEKKAWNREGFEDFVIDTTMTEDGKTKIYGFTGSRMYLLEGAVLNNGVSYLTRSSDGTYVSELDSEKAIDAVDWVQQLLRNHPECYLTYNDSPRTVTDLFCADGATTLLMSTWWLFLYIVYDVDNFAVMPFPSMNSDENSGLITAYQSNLMACIPSMADEPVYSAIVIDKLFEPFEEYPDRQSIKDYYTGQVFHDARDVDILYKMADHTSYCYNYVGGETFYNTISDQLDSKTAVEHLSTVVSSLQTVIDDYIEPNYEYMSAH